MSTGFAVRWIILIVCLCLSAFFSSAETALTTVSKIRMRSLAEEGNRRAQTVLKITDDPSKMLTAILIGNNLVNISASSISTTLALAIFGSAGVGVATGVLTILILIFGEISPKTMATIRSERMSLRYANVIWTLMRILTPVIFVVNALAGAFLRLLRVDPNEKNKVMTERELRTIVEMGHESGVIEMEEKQMINNVFDFGDAKAEAVMVQRIDMVTVSADATYDEIMKLFGECRYTRIPVYEGTPENVIGILNMKDLLLCGKEQFRLREVMREPYFTYEQKNTADLFLEMRQNSINIVLVLDEYGMTSGLITMEDLIEEIVGEIRDEYDEDEEDPIRRLSDREFLVEGSLHLDDLNRELALHLKSEDYDSIGGYMIGLLDHLPRPGESLVTEEGIFLQVCSMEKHRIETMFLRLPEEKTEQKNREKH